MTLRPNLLLCAAVALGAASAAAQPGGHDATTPRQGGQAAFAAIAEIVAVLEADPDTDWSRVDVPALGRHLADMDAVTLRADIAAEPVDGGWRLSASGDGPTRDAVRRMLSAHAAAMPSEGSLRFAFEATASGAALIVTGDGPDAATRIGALGLLGVLAQGAHHPRHHLMIARGAGPHG